MSASEENRGAPLEPRQSRSYLRWLARLIIGVVCFFSALYILDWRRVLQTLVAIDGRAFGLALVLVIIMFFLMGVRWFFLVSELVPLGFQYHLRCFFTANFANVFTPANLGGDAYRFLMLRPHAKRTIHLIIALLQERFIGIAGYAALYFLLLLWFATIDGGDFSGGAVSFLLLAGVLAIALAVAWTLGVLPQIGRSLPLVRNRERFVALVDTLMLASRFGGMRRAGVLLGLSLLGGIIWTSVPLIVAHSLGMQVPYGALGTIVIFVEFIRIVPITIQGIGVREGLFAYCFSLLHLSPEKGFLIGTVSYFALSLGLLAVGIISRLLPEKPRAH